jgi:hypothetical protein
LQNLWCFGDGEHIANQVLEVDLIDLAGYVLNLWCFGDGEHITNQVLEVNLIDLAGYKHLPCCWQVGSHGKCSMAEVGKGCEDLISCIYVQ